MEYTPYDDQGNLYFRLVCLTIKEEVSFKYFVKQDTVVHWFKRVHKDYNTICFRLETDEKNPRILTYYDEELNSISLTEYNRIIFKRRLLENPNEQ